MRILLVNTHHFRGGGDSTYTLNLADLLRDQGHDVAFFAMQDSRNLPDPNADLFVSHIDFRELNQHRSLLAGIRVLRRAIYSYEARHKFSQLLDRFQPDVVHLQNILGHITSSIIFEAKKRDLPVIWTLHDYKLICPNTHLFIDSAEKICEACDKGRYYQAVLKRCKKDSLLASGMAALEAYVRWALRVRDYVDAFLAPSVFLRNKLVDHGFPPGKIHHLPYLLPAETFQNGSYKDDGYLLFFGRLTHIKGVCTLLDACRLAPEIQLVLAGRVEGALKNELQASAPSNAQYVGMKQGEELQQLLRGALVAVVPSLWYENQPFSVLEAFACAKPVIASDLGGMAELVKDGERGLLVPPGDAQALASAMRWMSAHPVPAQEMGRLAQVHARQNHGGEGHYERIMRIYQEVLGRT